MARVWTVVMVAVLALPALAPAQMSWLAFSRLVEGKDGAAGMALIMKDKELMDGLVADGVIAGWGIAVPATHRPGDRANFLEWVSIEDWGKVDQWVGRVMAKQQSIDPDEHKAMIEEFMATFEPRSHFDEVVRNAVIRTASEEAMEKTAIFYVSSYTAKEGEGDAFVDLVESQAVPLADGLVEGGTAIAYGLHVAEVHGVEGWTHRFWWALPNLESVGILKQTVAEAGQDLRTALDEITVPGTHFDTIWVSMFVDMAADQ